MLNEAQWLTWREGRGGEGHRQELQYMTRLKNVVVYNVTLQYPPAPLLVYPYYQKTPRDRGRGCGR